MSAEVHKFATFIKELPVVRPKGERRQCLYRMDPPHEGHEYVIVSSVKEDMSVGVPVALLATHPAMAEHMMLHETYIFPATAEGEVLNFGELDGSYRGGTNHEEALNNAGYEVLY